MFKIAMCVRENRKSASRNKINTPISVYNQIKNIEEMQQECMLALTVNTKNKLIDIHLITLGILDASLVHPREVFKNAILDSAWGVVIAHNHPSGDLTPSPEDIRITRQLVDAGRILDIRILDHIIISKQDNGSNNFFSLRESGMVSF